VLINTARAGIVDDEALLEAIDSRGLRVGLDVFPGEPATAQAAFEHPLAKHPAVYGTHHIGASTTQAQRAVADAVVKIVIDFCATGHIDSSVNLTERGSADHALVVRHRDRVGVLAAVLQQLQQASLNVQEMENRLFEGGAAAVARIAVCGKPGNAVIKGLRAHPDILHVSTTPL
jgi:D-3-phosphoglycerate dehydrogenase